MLRAKHPSGISHGPSQELKWEVVSLAEQMKPVGFLKVSIRQEVDRTVGSRCFQDRIVAIVPGEQCPPLDGERFGGLWNRKGRKCPNVLSWLADWFISQHVLLARKIQRVVPESIIASNLTSAASFL
jgi:hypothetical protein